MKVSITRITTSRERARSETSTSLNDPDGCEILHHMGHYMSPLNITQPLGINGLLDGYYKVMSNIPKMGQLPTPASPQGWFFNPNKIMGCLHGMFTTYQLAQGFATIHYMLQTFGSFLK